MARPLLVRSHHDKLVLALAAALGACAGPSTASPPTIVASRPPGDVVYEDLDQEGDDDLHEGEFAMGEGEGAAASGITFTHLGPTTIHPSLVSFAVKMGAKRVSRGTLKNFIKTKIKEPLGKLTDNKLAKELAAEADLLLGMLDDPWWSTAIGFVPIVGDALDLARVPSQMRKALGRARALEDKVHAALDAERKARQAARPVSSVGHHISAPKSIRAFPDLIPAGRKTPLQGGGLLRKRWKDKDGNIYEWDYQHGRLEKYDRRERHLGEFDSDTGALIKGPDPTRNVEP